MLSQTLLRTAQSMSEAAETARQVLIQTHNFNKFSAFLERTASSLQESSKFEAEDSETVIKATENLDAEIEVANRLALDCSKANKIYLLLSCRRIAEELDKITKNISHAMLPFRSLYKNMEQVQYQVSAFEQEILHKIETGIQDRSVDRSYASDLLLRIAESVGISTEKSELKTEFEHFKNQLQGIGSRTEASRMEQIILLLGNADMVTTPREKEIKYFTKRNSLGRRLLEPLQSFYCPITADIMADPVETSSGHTFEREAIDKWLAEGNSLCPLTKTPLSKSGLRPNRVLRQSIEEWRNRNTMITIASIKTEIQSGDEQEVLYSLNKLQDLCQMSQLHREWIVLEDYIPIITRLLSAKTSGFRLHALAILYYLAKDCDENKVFFVVLV